MQEITNSIDNLNAKMLLHTIDESISLSKNNAMTAENYDKRQSCGDTFCFGINPAEMRNLSEGQDKYSSKRLMEVESTCLRNLLEKNKKKVEQDNKFLEQFHGLCEVVGEAESIAFDFEENDADFSQSANCLFFGGFEQENAGKLFEEKATNEEVAACSTQAENIEIVKLRKHSSENLSKSTRTTSRKSKNTNQPKKGISKKHNSKIKKQNQNNSKELQKEQGQKQEEEQKQQCPISQDPRTHESP